MQEDIQPDNTNQNVETTELTYLQSYLNDQMSKVKLCQNHLFFKVMIGKYFIQSYRIFKMIPEENSLILFKRQQNKTNYNFLLILNSLDQIQKKAEILVKQSQNPIQKMKSMIQKLIRKPLQCYSVSIALIKEMKKLTFLSLQNYKKFIQNSRTQTNFQLLSKIISAEPYSQILDDNKQIGPFKIFPQVECFVPKLKKQKADLLFDSQKDFDALKQLVSLYIDTFANQQKGGYIYKEIQKSSISFSVDILLNTVNYIIFEELNGSCYSQIEPSYWTCFQSSTRSLNSDRKHVTLTGNGQICVLEIIFMKDVESENKTEYTMMLTEFKKFYKKATIKIYRITNEKWNGQLQKINLEQEENAQSNSPQIIYKFHSTVAREYSAPN